VGAIYNTSTIALCAVKSDEKVVYLDLSAPKKHNTETWFSRLGSGQKANDLALLRISMKKGCGSKWGVL
jgi:late competence protein required for DNA uptake (superfamily II DNA/RNA helicase)